MFRVADQVVTNTAPAFTTGAAFSTDENQRATFQVTATDDDAGDEVSYAITGGADQTLFTIGATNGLLASVTLPDHENPADADSEQRLSGDRHRHRGDGRPCADVPTRPSP